MRVSSNSDFAINSPKIFSFKPNQKTKRFTYIGMIPILAVVLLLSMFGLMGALPSLVEAQTSIWYAIPTGTSSDSCLIDDPCDLQTAVTSAQPGDEVRAASGTYTFTAPLSVTQSISLTGGYELFRWQQLECSQPAFTTSRH